MSSTQQKRALLGSELFCLSQGSACIGTGRWKCHWCGADCLNEFVHDDLPPIPFMRSTSTALCPFETYICYGCRLWRRPRVTISFLAGGFKDGQTAKNHSWWITESHAWALKDKLDYDEVFKLLIKPPKKFILALKEEGKTDTLLQLTKANDPGGIIAETPLYFTLNNIPHSYTIYELIESIRNNDPEPYGAGVRVLWNFLGGPPQEMKKKYQKDWKDEIRKQGERIVKDDPKKTIKKMVVASGKEE